MTRPPRGVFVPSKLIFHPQLPAAVLVSWIKLRSLAWRGFSTPPMNLAELASRLAIHPARLARHLAQLQEISALDMRQALQDKIVLSFPDEASLPPKNPNQAQASTVPIAATPEKRAMPTYSSYFPSRILGYISYADDDEESPQLNEAEQPASSEAINQAQRIPEFTLCSPREHHYLPK